MTRRHRPSAEHLWAVVTLVLLLGLTQPQARVKIEGDPARVRELLEATDLKAIAAFR
jgi:hypothetical protein